MMLVGDAAMLLWFDIVPETIPEHDEWHTREHFPERVGIPGFRRASRWICAMGSPRYLIAYEVEDVGVLSSAPYLDRLNHPSPWTQRMMPSYRGMTRAFFEVRRVVGESLGACVLCIRCEPATGREASLRRWIEEEALEQSVSQRGIAGAAFLEAARQPEMTAEQRIRGRDATARWVLLVSAYDTHALDELGQRLLAADRFEHHGAVTGIIAGSYGLACMSAARA